MNDIELLRRYEPVVQYTDGEHFFPCAVDEYVRRASLWQLGAKGQRTKLIDEGLITADTLAALAQTAPGHTSYLRFVPKPLGAIDFQHWRTRPNATFFHAPGRFTRVGLVSRILSSFLNISLLVRGTVPGGTAAAAEIRYQEMRAADPRDVYYGRVIRQGGYTVLHYLFFFAMNDWRSSFFGINDHEADWEQCFIFLANGAEGQFEPRWVAFASHDYVGDDLRRRWDDPDLVVVDGCHPVISAGAGSHSSYFLKGEYLAGVEPKALRPLKNIAVRAREFWAGKLSQGANSQIKEEVSEFFRVAFVDYARGDGVAIGPGQSRAWSPILMDGQEWIEQYRGLWGVDTEDPFGGERAPAGPKYNRDGAVRLSWYDPLAWAGLDKVPTPQETPALLAEQITRLTGERTELEQTIAAKRQQVRELALEVSALKQTEYLAHLATPRSADLLKAQTELQALTARATANEETQTAAVELLSRIEQGDWGDPHAHLRHQHKPEAPMPAQSRILDLWGAVSGAALLLVLALMIIVPPARWYLWIVVAVLIFLGVESGLRGKLDTYLLNVIIFLAIVTSLILLITNWREVLVAGVFLLVLMMMRDNLRELSRK